MADYKEIVAVVKRKGRDGDEKSFWTKIGVAFQTKDGSGWMLKLDYFPTNPETGIMLTDPKPRDGGGRSSGGGRPQSREREPGEDFE